MCAYRLWFCFRDVSSVVRCLFNFLGIRDILMMFDEGILFYCAAPLNIVVATFKANAASRRAVAESLEFPRKKTRITASTTAHSRHQTTSTQPQPRTHWHTNDVTVENGHPHFGRCKIRRTCDRPQNLVHDSKDHERDRDRVASSSCDLRARPDDRCYVAGLFLSTARLADS